MKNQELERLMQEHSSAKSKMTLGIIFTAIGYVLMLIGMWYTSVIFFMLLFFGVGIPFLVIGIVNRIKINTKISALKNEMLNTTSTPDTPEIKPIFKNVDVQPQKSEKPPVNVTENTTADVVESSNGFVGLDWEKYSPLDCGVSYNKNKDYKFHRADGFAGSVPQKFIDRTFPKCPMCCSAEPHWHISQHNQMSWKGNLYLFKCSHCDSIISMSMPDVTTLSNGASGVVGNPNVGLTNLLVKASSGKEAGAVYAVIESVGKSEVSTGCEGKEFKLEDLQDMYLRG